MRNPKFGTFVVFAVSALLNSGTALATSPQQGMRTEGTSVVATGTMGEPVQVLWLASEHEVERLSLHARGRVLELRLEPNEQLFADDIIWRHDQVVQPYERDDMPMPLKGEVEGMPGSWARIDFVNGQPDGLIYLPGEGDVSGELWELRQQDGQTTVALFGERANLQFGAEPGPMCGVLTPPSAQPDEAVELTDAPQDAVGSCLTLDLAVVGDWVFVSNWGGTSSTEAHARGLAARATRLWRVVQDRRRRD